MKVGILGTATWRTPPRHYGPWELFVYNLAEALLDKGIDVTVFATKDSKTRAKLKAIVPVPYREHPSKMPERIWETQHIGFFYEHADEFDILHNSFDFIPLTYSRLVDKPLVTTIHGFSSSDIIPIYVRYHDRCAYVSISFANRHPDLKYIANVYHGINLAEFDFSPKGGDYLLFLGRISRDKGTDIACQLAKKVQKKLIIAGIVPPEEEKYFNQKVKPDIDGKQIKFIGPVGPKEKNEILGKAQALVHLINFEEPFGFTLIEAMATGTPIIGFNKGAVAEIIADGKTGFVVDNLQEAEGAVARISEIKREACRKRVEDNFTREIMAKNYLKVYQKVIDEYSRNKKT